MLLSVIAFAAFASAQDVSSAMQPSAAPPTPPVPFRSVDAKPNPQREAIEECVWNGVQERIAAGMQTNEIDAQLAVGRAATESCLPLIDRWAMTAPVVIEDGEPVQDVARRMQVHFVARGTLFAAGKAEPFYREPSHESSPASREPVPAPTYPRTQRPIAPPPESCATAIRTWENRRNVAVQMLESAKRRLSDGSAGAEQSLEIDSMIMGRARSLEAAETQLTKTRKRCAEEG